MRAYYNDSDRYVAAWLRNLIAAGLIPDGDVDERDIHDVQPADVRGYTQAHFFAGIGGWAYALRLAGWPPDAAIWTGSCPCQPYSAAGKGGGDDDPRNLWPQFRRLIAECRPPVVFGEQVASADGRAWLSGVRADLEELGYAVGAADLCAAGVGAPHIRQRLYWVADADHRRREQRDPRERGLSEPHQDGSDDRLAHASLGGLRADGSASREPGHVDLGGEGCGLGDSWSKRRSRLIGSGAEAGAVGEPGDGLDNPASARRDQAWSGEQGEPERGTGGFELRRGASPWSDAVLVLCTDGKTRRVKSGLSPLAHGVPARVGKLRAYGNAIVPALAAEFVRAYRDG